MCHISKITGKHVGDTNNYLKPIDVLLGISAAWLTASYLIGELVNDDVKWALLLQRLVKIELTQMYDENVTKHGQILPADQQRLSCVEATGKLLDRGKL